MTYQNFRFYIISRMLIYTRVSLKISREMETLGLQGLTKEKPLVANSRLPLLPCTCIALEKEKYFKRNTLKKSNVFIYFLWYICKKNISKLFSLFFYIMHIFQIWGRCAKITLTLSNLKGRKKSQTPKQFCVKISFYYTSYKMYAYVYTHVSIDIWILLLSLPTK